MSEQFASLMNQAITSIRNTKKRRGHEETDSDSNESGDMDMETKKNQDENSGAESGMTEGVPQTGVRSSDVPLPQTGKGRKYERPLALMKF